MSYKVAAFTMVMAAVLSLVAIVLSVSNISISNADEREDSYGLYSKETTDRIIATFVPTSYAAVRTDHGLPMTNVPYRYSAYFFMLAVILGNLYRTVRKARDQMPGDLSW